MARKANEKATIPIVFSETSPLFLPSVSSTSESSLTWQRLMAGNRLTRYPCRSEYSIGKTVANRLATRNRQKNIIHNMQLQVGTGIAMPNETKNNVTKKSRRLVTRATISSV